MSIVDAWMAGMTKIADDLATLWMDVFDLWYPSSSGAAKSVATTTVAVTGSGRLQPTAFLDGSGHSIPATCVTLVPALLAPGSSGVAVVVTVKPPAETPAGTFVGAIVDAKAAIVADRVAVTV